MKRVPAASLAAASELAHLVEMLLSSKNEAVKSLSVLVAQRIDRLLNGKAAPPRVSLAELRRIGQLGASVKVVPGGPHAAA